MRYVLYIILLVVLVGALIGGFHLYRVSVKNKKEMSKFEGKEVVITRDFGKVLVVYFSQSGHTKDIAERIRARTNADMYEIKTINALPKGPKLHLAIKNQLKTEDYPEIEKDFPNFRDYDIIFVGSPVWWYTVSTPMMSFLESADFGGVKVVPFSTQGSNVGSFFEDFALKAKNANLQKSEKFNNLSSKFDNEVDNKVAIWLNEL